MFRALRYFALSGATYICFREDFEFPNTATLTKLTSKTKCTPEDIYLEILKTIIF